MNSEGNQESSSTIRVTIAPPSQKEKGARKHFEDDAPCPTKIARFELDATCNNLRELFTSLYGYIEKHIPQSLTVKIFNYNTLPNNMKTTPVTDDYIRDPLIENKISHLG